MTVEDVNRPDPHALRVVRAGLAAPRQRSPHLESRPDPISSRTIEPCGAAHARAVTGEAPLNVETGLVVLPGRAGDAWLVPQRRHDRVQRGKAGPWIRNLQHVLLETRPAPNDRGPVARKQTAYARSTRAVVESHHGDIAEVDRQGVLWPRHREHRRREIEAAGYRRPAGILPLRDQRQHQPGWGTALPRAEVHPAARSLVGLLENPALQHATPHDHIGHVRP